MNVSAFGTMILQRIQPLLAVFLALLAVFSARADEASPAAVPTTAPAAAAPAADSAGESAVPEYDRTRIRPGRSDRVMTPGMKEYVAKLESIRLSRDAQARAAIQAEKDIEARKGALAEEKEDVKALVDKAAELRAALEETEKALGEIWDEDEEIVRLRAVREAAEASRVAKNREMQTAIQAAMRDRAALFENGDGPEIRSVDAAKAAVRERKPQILIGGKNLEEFRAAHPEVSISNFTGRALVPSPVPVGSGDTTAPAAE